VSDYLESGTDALQKELKKVIRKMKKVQKNISADGQPVSAHELEALRKLGQRYIEIIKSMGSNKSC